MFKVYKTEYDPGEESEGTIDPLGLYTIADGLAVKMIPGLRERQKHPRYLTIIAAGLSLCEDFDEERLASDEVSPPWQVYEWLAVRSMEKRQDSSQNKFALPGVLKAKAARSDGMPLTAKRYLSVPSVFGFHGVYRLLSKNLGVELNGNLGNTGAELLDAWMNEQNLMGFFGTSNGPGKAIRKQLYSAVSKGLEAGGVASDHEVFFTHLHPLGAGTQEAKVLYSALLNDENQFRKQVFDFLISNEGQKIWNTVYPRSEKQLHDKLKSVVSSDLKEILSAIDLYEQFARHLFDAFYACIDHLSKTKRKITVSELATLDKVISAATEVPNLYLEVSNSLNAVTESQRFEEIFEGFDERLKPPEWLSLLLQHHIKIQRNKPPNPKNPWFEQTDDGQFIIRRQYMQRAEDVLPEGYVHAYRTNSMWQFAKDLGQVK